MALFYKREETPSEIIISFKFNVHLLIYVGTIILMNFLPKFTGFILVYKILAVIPLIYFCDILKPIREIDKAMRKGCVKLSGSRFSLSKPLTYKIDKDTKKT